MNAGAASGWLQRHLGWSGSREQWLALFGGAGWLAGLAVILHFSRNWTVGQTLLAIAAWVFVLAVVGRAALRDLFGPVFFYELMRVSRNANTFRMRFLYVGLLGVLLSMMYFSWIESYTMYGERSDAQPLLFLACCCVLGAVGIHIFTRDLCSPLMRGLSIAAALIAFGYFAGMCLESINRVGWGGGPDALPPGEISRFATDFFQAFVIIQVLVICLLTPVYVAGTIAVEKERKTLEFLLATDLRNREIIFGKLAARVLLMLQFVLLGLPIIAFLQLFGGIDPEALLAVSAGSLALIIGLSALSIWVSGTVRKARDAIALTYMYIAFYAIGSWILEFLTSPMIVLGTWNQPVQMFGYSVSLHDFFVSFASGNPISAISRTVMTGGIGAALREFLVFWFIATALLAGSAILKVRSVALHQAYGGVGQRRVRRHPLAERIDASGKPVRPTGRRRQSNRPPIDGNPVTWKEVFLESNLRGGWLGSVSAIMLLVMLLLPLGIMVYIYFIGPLYYGPYRSFDRRWLYFIQGVNGWVRIVSGVLGFLMMISAALRGAGAITGEKDRDTWISLISTPLSSWEILRGKWWGCMLGLRNLYLLLILVWGVGLAVGAVFPPTILVMILLTFVYVSAFSWVGIFCSLTSRNTLVSSIRAFFAALFCAGGFWLLLGWCCFMPMSMSRVHYRTMEKVSSFFYGFTPPLVYGFTPVSNDLDRIDRELGPFYRDETYGSGLSGPLFGTLFWLVFSIVMASYCNNLLSRKTNRDVRKPQLDPDAHARAAGSR